MKTLELKDTGFLREVEKRAATPVGACLQCHKCSTGCPVGPETDFLASQVMRLIHLGQETELLESRAIWLCASCEACTTRCPMQIDIAGVMDTLRMMAVEKKVAIPDTHSKHFNNAFLSSVRRHGRVHELSMMAHYKISSRDLFSDMDKVPKMLAKKKLNLMPHFSKDRKKVKQVFNKAREEEKKR